MPMPMPSSCHLCVLLQPKAFLLYFWLCNFRAFNRRQSQIFWGGLLALFMAQPRTRNKRKSNSSKDNNFLVISLFFCLFCGSFCRKCREYHCNWVGRRIWRRRQLLPLCVERSSAAKFIDIFWKVKLLEAPQNMNLNVRYVCECFYLYIFVFCRQLWQQ